MDTFVNEDKCNLCSNKLRNKGDLIKSKCCSFSTHKWCLEEAEFKLIKCPFCRNDMQIEKNN